LQRGKEWIDISAKVYLAERRSFSARDNLVQKVGKLFDEVGAAAAIEKNALVAVKTHFGERGGTAYLHPVLVRQVVEKIKEAGGKPFLCDTNTLYAGGRSNAVDHLETALRHGFSYATAGAPLVIADGLRGRSYHEVPIKGKHFQSARIGSAVVEADALIVLSHVKGHMLTGFGGALKNLGMGCGNRAGKQSMHSVLKPAIKEDRCRLCGTCVQWCPAGALTLRKGKGAEINLQKCSGCGECIISCTYGAVQVRWQSEMKDVVERIVEYAAGALQGKEEKAVFFNFILDLAPDCDCCSWSDSPVVPDVGIAVSRDPVAVDQASADLVNGQAGIRGSALQSNFEPGEDKFGALHPATDYRAKLAYAAAIGLGTRDYELIKITFKEPGKER
jgi:uncharacterized Fe-S center protein